jgi:hypothetical protein
MENKKFDKRLIKRNINDGIISKKEYTTVLEELPDLQESTEQVNVPLYKWEVEAHEQKLREEAAEAVKEAQREAAVANEAIEAGEIPVPGVPPSIDSPVIGEPLVSGMPSPDDDVP